MTIFGDKGYSKLEKVAPFFLFSFSGFNFGESEEQMREQ
jgi:hypothetical protein